MASVVDIIDNVIDTDEYEILDQYYVKNTNTGMMNIVGPESKGINDYFIKYQAINKEMFTSLLVVSVEESEFILANIYGKYSGEWKLNILNFGQYKMYGETAPEIYISAREKYKDGSLINALLEMMLCSALANPVGKYWEYKNDKEMKDFFEQITNELDSQFSFPLTITSVFTKPQILSIVNQPIDEGIFTLVNYQTSIDLKDTVNTRIENNKIHSEIENIFPGINDKKYTFYRAWNKIPSEQNPQNSYGFVKENW